MTYTPPVYLTPEHPDAFRDIPLKARPDLIEPAYIRRAGDWVECPKCEGHGHWNLLLDQYPGDYPEHRHFQAHCSQCHGWGWVIRGSVDHTCLHELEEVPTGVMFDHRFVCRKGCGKDFTVDSSG